MSERRQHGGWWSRRSGSWYWSIVRESSQGSIVKGKQRISSRIGSRVDHWCQDNIERLRGRQDLNPDSSATGLLDTSVLGERLVVSGSPGWVLSSFASRDPFVPNTGSGRHAWEDGVEDGMSLVDVEVVFAIDNADAIALGQSPHVPRWSHWFV
jgi:hypothetical protein